jgi:hypothetical protein
MVNQVYPFSTADGQAIPLDIIKSSGLVKKDFTALSTGSFTLVAGEVGVLLASAPCLVRFGTTIPEVLLDGTLYSDMYLVPRDTVITVSLTAGIIYVRGIEEDGTLYLQLIEKWAGLALAKQYSRK